MRNTHWLTSPFFFVVLSGVLLIPGVVRAAPNEAPPVNEPAPAAVEPAPTKPAVQEEPAPPAEAGDIQERGLVPKVVPGGVTGGVLGGTAAPPPRMVGPTYNLTEVANAFSLRHKSLTTLITVAPNLPVTQSVEISIGYYSPAGTQRITQSYVAGTGNRFLYLDNGGDGKPRRMRVDISLREPKPGGGFSTFSFPMQVDLDPLYDVSISPLTFKLLSGCDELSYSDIWLYWYSPDHSRREVKFDLRAGQTRTFPQFAWARAEVSASHNLHRPSIAWTEEDLIAFRLANLVPGKTEQVTYVQDIHDCNAAISYAFTYTLRWYPDL